MELKPGHKVSLLSKKTGATLDIKVQESGIVVSTQDIESYITFSSEGVLLEPVGEVLVGRYEEDE